MEKIVILYRLFYTRIGYDILIALQSYITCSGLVLLIFMNNNNNNFKKNWELKRWFSRFRFRIQVWFTAPKWQLTTICDSGTRKSDVLFWPPQMLNMNICLVQTHMFSQALLCISKHKLLKITLFSSNMGQNIKDALSFAFCGHSKRE